MRVWSRVEHPDGAFNAKGTLDVDEHDLAGHREGSRVEGFGWAEPDEEVHAFINDLERPVGTYLYGRRMYETMAVWETDATLAAQSELRYRALT